MMIMFTKVKNKQYQPIDDYVSKAKNKQYQSIDDYVYKGKTQAVSIY